jgi:hypothetical protein
MDDGTGGFKRFDPGEWSRTYEGAVEASWAAAKRQDTTIAGVELCVLETWVRGNNPISDYRVVLGRPM